MPENDEKQRTSGVPLHKIVMPKCDKHDYQFIMGTHVPSGPYSEKYKRVHWCKKCGRVQVSYAGGPVVEIFDIGEA